MAYKYFTLAEAEKLLPWLRNQLEALSTAHELLTMLENDRQILLAKTTSNGTSHTEDNLDKNGTQQEQTSAKVSNLADLISAEGIIVREVSVGLVDFPTMHNGEEAYLCWYKDEEAINYWHPVNTGVSGRQPI